MRASALLIVAAFALPALAASPDEMIVIPAGEFIMGSDTGPEDERPAHRVTLPAFRIDRLPVTNAEFAAFLNAKGPGTAVRWYDHDDADARIRLRGGRWVSDAAYENHPAVEPTWAGAREYCAWRGKRLPTEAEWEKAARGTDGRRYPWGHEAADRTRAQFAAGWNATASADGFPAGASPYGVLDLAGNTWEWVSSLYRSYPYRPDDGREDLAASGVRGTRGGGHDSSADEITTTQRGRTLSRNPRAGHHNIGFRCAQ